MPRAKKPVKPPPPPWTPEEVRQVSQAIWGEQWQTALAAEIKKTLMWERFSQARVAKWFLTTPNRRPIPTMVQVNLTEVLGYAMDDAEEARWHAKLILEAHAE